MAKSAAPSKMPQSVKILMSDFSMLAEGFSSSDGTMLETPGQVSLLHSMVIPRPYLFPQFC